MPPTQTKRDLIAKMKLIPVHELIQGQRLLLIDDSIVRGTQLRETTEFLYHSGAKEVHVRPACPPLLFGCKYISFSRSTTEMELIARRVIYDLESGNATGRDVSTQTGWAALDHDKDLVERTVLEDYANPDSDRYHRMLDEICARLGFTSLAYNRIDDMLEAIGQDPDNLCTYCWNGRE